MHRTYYALIDVEDGIYGIRFPDFPGCVSSGATLGEAIANGTEALTDHIEVTADYGEPIPEPSDAVSPEEGDVLTAITVRVPGKIKRYNVSLDSSLVREIDRRVGPGQRSRFLADAARVRLGEA